MNAYKWIGATGREPVVLEGFPLLASERGWRYFEEYVEPLEDDDEAFWQRLIRREEKQESGVLWGWHQTVSAHIVDSGDERMWAFFLDFADKCWERFCEQQAEKEKGPT